MRRFGYRRIERIITIAIVAVMVLSVIFALVSQSSQKKLSVYTESDKVEEETPKEEELDIILSQYTDEKNSFSIGVPDDWQQVTKNGYPTFVHSASSSSIQIQVLEYNPAINNVSADTISAEVAGQGKTFVEYTRLDSSSYEATYQDYQNSTYDYIEKVYWDRTKIIKLIATFNDKNYQKIKPYYEKIYASFSWERPSEIPSKYYLYYNEAAKFEVGIPTTWTLSSADNAIAATDSETNASMTVSVTQNTGYLDSVTANDIVSLLKPGRNNFMMKSYDHTKEKATVVSTYVVNNVQITNKTFIFANGTYMYFLSFDYEQGIIDDSIPENCANLFREFIS